MYIPMKNDILVHRENLALQNDDGGILIYE